MQDKKFIAQQYNRFMQMSVQSANLPDDQAMEVADLYPDWVAMKAYAVDEIVKYGVNADGETQLYKVIQAHTSQEDWKPDVTASLYKAIGFTDDGVSIWTQPLGATDAYMKGDVVSFEDQLWISTVDNNVWQPGVYGWEVQA
mgnify:FL=1|jgi:hypothetical protein